MSTYKRNLPRVSKKLRLGAYQREYRLAASGRSVLPPTVCRGFFVSNNLPPPHGGGYCLHYDQVNSFNTCRPAKTTSKDRVRTDAARRDLCNFMYLQHGGAVKKIDPAAMSWTSRRINLLAMNESWNMIFYIILSRKVGFSARRLSSKY